MSLTQSLLGVKENKVFRRNRKPDPKQGKRDTVIVFKRLGTRVYQKIGEPIYSY